MSRAGQTSVMISTDDDYSSLQKTDPAWKRYECDVRGLLDKIDGSQVTHDAKLDGKLSQKKRQVDVLIEGSVAASQIVIIVECKHYAKPLGIGKIDEFAGKLADVQADRGVIYALNGLTQGATVRAKNAHPKIEIRTLEPNSPDRHSWDDFLSDVIKFGDCENENCLTGDVNWSEWLQDGGKAVIAGSCDNCGTWAIKCECGESTGFFSDKLKCMACGRCYEITRAPDGCSGDVVMTEGPAGASTGCETEI